VRSRLPGGVGGGICEDSPYPDWTAFAQSDNAIAIYAPSPTNPYLRPQLLQQLLNGQNRYGRTQKAFIIAGQNRI
jgi:hypothetical protein